MKGVVCFDIGGTGVKYALVNEDGIHEKGSFKTNRENGQEVLRNMVDVVHAFEKGNEIEGVSLSSPGFIDADAGTVLAGNVIEGFNGMNLREYFKEKTGYLLAIENDANCATIAEHRMGNGRGCENMAVVTIGTGIGGGLIINNKIYSGNRHMAGEFGFMFINGIKTDRCEDEILSGYASTRVLVENTRLMLQEEIDGPEIFERAANGDVICQKALSDFYDALAMGIYNICYTMAPEAVLLGGAVSAQPVLIEEVKKRISALTPSFSIDLNTICKIEPCKYLNDAGLAGAYSNFRNTFE